MSLVRPNQCCNDAGNAFSLTEGNWGWTVRVLTSPPSKHAVCQSQRSQSGLGTVKYHQAVKRALHSKQTEVWSAQLAQQASAVRRACDHHAAGCMLACWHPIAREHDTPCLLEATSIFHQDTAESHALHPLVGHHGDQNRDSPGLVLLEPQAEALQDCMHTNAGPHEEGADPRLP